MSEPTRHHYIPIFYLKRWTGPDKRLWEFSRPYRKTIGRRKHPSATAYVNSLYTIPDVPAEHAQFVEKRFMQLVDHWAAKAHDIMLRPNPRPDDLDLRMKVGWARFLYSLVIRTPEQIRRIQQKSDANQPELIENLRDEYHLVREPSDPETFEEFKAWRLANPLSIPAQRMLPTLINSERVISELVSWRWTTANCTGTEHSMLTSDRPVIMTNGLSVPNAHLVVPLSPSVIFFAIKNEETHREIMSSSINQMVEAVNHKVCEQAIKFVYGTDDSQRRFVANRLGKMVQSSPFG